MEKFLIEYKYNESFNAGSKARDDINIILNEFDYTRIQLNMEYNYLKKIIHIINLKNFLKNITNESVVFLQWPIATHKYANQILKILKKKNCKIIIIIHDLISLRFNKKDLILKEINLLNKADVIISHNYIMTKWLNEKGLKTKTIELNIFDYIHNLKIDNKIRKDNYKIDFAGNLSKEKSGFIYKFSDDIIKNFKLNLYGANFENNINYNKIEFKGKFLPEELPGVLEGDFGLIWDGEDLETCSGVYGEYLKYNNPHKLSLYISSGIPVIVWKESAISKFVLDNNIGISINDLNELDNKLENLKNYNELKTNANLMKRKLITGYFTKNAILEALNYIENN
ncbi:hypothetical protein OEG88_02245 [Clostridium perfringens]|uniref:hypothetical protein n=1 Tax=Clostridium perfringens TaxID=1502 RepID=UPI001A24DD56|nr:hypothetical protein [Clostridium perfringens]MDM0986308.1 hypothetical protein [Clostridium perfringens]UYC93419.1 hypothetical protein OEG88_02245 [Clostridium perfringens]HAT4204383.1 galactofuranosyltransferase [Clostridium perfringens]